MQRYTNKITGTVGTIENLVSELNHYELKLSGKMFAKDVHTTTVEGCDDDAYTAGYGIDGGHGFPDDVTIVRVTPATLKDVSEVSCGDMENLDMYVICIEQE